MRNFGASARRRSGERVARAPRPGEGATISDRIRTYDSRSAAYRRAFDVFLAHTDQKARAREWLRGLVDGLPARENLVDAGAGNGAVTEWLLRDFGRTVAIEPNPSLRAELRRRCPTAEVVPATILDAEISVPADLILCSHVLYYVPGEEWMSHLERLVSWMAPGGAVVVVVQNHRTDCMRMLRHFCAHHFVLPELAERFEALWGRRYRVEMATVPAEVTTPTLDPALIIAEFILNLLPMDDPPRRAALGEYVHEHFARAGGGFRLSCDQDCLIIRPRGAAGST